MKKTLLSFFGITAIIMLNACNSRKKGKSDIEVIFTPDTLNVGYTYWWPESGPFIGECSTELSLVFRGIVTELDEPTEEAGPLYTSQNGIIRIEQVYKIKDLGTNKYTNQNYFKSDCFNGLDLKIGDAVLVTCYDYEEDYTIPGNKSILKISGIEDSIITSIKKFIDKDQNPIKIRKDLKTWKKHKLDIALEKQIHCKKEMLKNN
ncbi:hypothetical protein CLV91_0749 [Maribacter vaceletii]|uniref:Uncharacterized protein n=1 Tax=Maribacter vaceletii TaxID=1206816 RepID=A0A495EDD5_9FLAO|nr:hypothetical protein [Maribacter vaceletii]RKR14671.1 hypothetical protein CLV91_0749 [Maribacter vaceletii]